MKSAIKVSVVVCMSLLAVNGLAQSSTITTVAGIGTAGFSGDNGAAASAQLNRPQSVAVDAAGNLFVADTGNHRIRKITPAGIITTVAGNGTADFSGDGGPAIAAKLNSPFAVLVDSVGNLFISDSGNNRVRKVSLDGTIITVAGSGRPTFPYTIADGGPATSAWIFYPKGLTIDTAGNLFIVDSGNNSIRKVNLDGIISTVAIPAYTTDDVAVDSFGNLFVPDSGRDEILRFTPPGVTSLVAGGNPPYFRDYSGDGGPAVSAGLTSPSRVTLDRVGNLFITDTSNYAIRKVGLNGEINTVAGNGIQGFSGDRGPATSAQLSGPNGMAVDGGGALFIADSNRIRKVALLPGAGNSTWPFVIASRGAAKPVNTDGLGTIAQGYVRIQPGVGSMTPAGVAIFGSRQNTVLISEAGVPASPLVQSARVYAEVSPNAQLNTGIALANPGVTDASISVQLTDTLGNAIPAGQPFVLKGGTQRAVFLNEDPFFSPMPFQGTLSLTSTVPISLIALRTFVNERSDFLMTTLPVVDPSVSAPNGVQFIPHFADGGGSTTHILLVNPTDNPLGGTVQFYGQGSAAAPGAPVNVDIGGRADSTFAYSVAPRSSMNLSTSGTASTLTTGSVRVTPSGGAVAPIPLLVFTYKPKGITLSEAGVAAVEGGAFRTYVEVNGAPGIPNSVQSGVAIANTSDSAGTVTLELTILDGSSYRREHVALPASGQIAGFLSDFFQDLPRGFRGVLRISTTTSGVSVVGIRSRYNEIGSYLMTTMPAVSEAVAPSSAEMLFPHIVNGFFSSGSYFTTEFILFSETNGQSTNGNLRFYRNDATVFPLTLD